MTNRIKRIVIVDSEESYLESLKISLPEIFTGWQIDFFNNAENALESLTDSPASCLVTDLLLPQMQGFELLKEVREKYPETVRIILAAKSQKNDLLKTIGPAHKFLTKPCDPLELKHEVERSFQLVDTFENQEIVALVNSLESLPSLPKMYFDLIELLHNPDSSIIDIADLIAQDPAISVKTLQLVNSAFFGLPRQVVSINLAVNLLGINIVSNLVSMVNVFHQYSEMQLQDFSIEYLTTHSVRTAKTAQAILAAEGVEENQQKTAYTAGLLHDIGKLIFILNLPEQYSEAVTLSQREKIPLFEAEREILKTDHQTVGAYLLHLWNFPDNIIESVAFHHNPELVRCHPLCPAVAIHLVNYFEHVLNPDSRKVSSNEKESYLLNVKFLKEAGLGKKVRNWLEIYRKIIKCPADVQIIID